MELRQLKHFLEVVRRSSFGEAANAVNLSQPAISKSIKNLEESLRVILVERTPTGVFPTPFGRVLYEYAQSIDNQISRAIDEIDAMRGSRRGIVRVGAGPSISRNLLPDIVSRFGRRLPGVDLILHEASKDELFLRLRRGEIDVIVSTILESDRQADLHHRVILLDMIEIVAAADHPLADKPVVTLADLVPFKWVMPGIAEPEREYLNRLFLDSNLPTPKAVVQTMSLGFLATYLPGTLHLSYASRRLSDVAALPGIVALPVDTEEWKRPVGVTTLKDAVVLPAVRVLIEELDKAGSLWARQG